MTALAQGVEADQLRSVASRLLTGVTIVTATSRTGPIGCTANAVTSLSLSPPLMLVCLRHQSSTLEAIREAGSFAINLLGGDEKSRRLCHRFATPAAARFDGVEHCHGTTGAPLVEGALGRLECILEDTFVAGDHTVCTGLVVDAEVMAETGSPLAFFGGRLFGVEAPTG